MSSVKISGDTSGVITVAAPAVSGTNTITMPAATGTMALTSDIPAAGGVTHLGTMTTTSGTSHTITGLDFTVLNGLIFVVSQVSHSDGTGRQLEFGIAGVAALAMGATVTSSQGAVGIFTFDLRSNTGVYTYTPAPGAGGIAPITSGNATDTAVSLAVLYDIGTNLRASSSTSVSVEWATGVTFDNGVIEVYGFK